MGYYTDFRIKAIDLRFDEINDPLLFERLRTATTDVLNGKWYEWEDDLKSVSRKQQCTFYILGVGENSDDIWVAKISNGRSTGKCKVSIGMLFEELDEL